MPLSPVLIPITSETALVFKTVRLRALQTDPAAFGSTYSQESQLDDAAWVERVQKWGSAGIGFLAMDGDHGCGMIAIFADDIDDGIAHVVSMWVAPEYRRSGLGRALIDAVKTWAIDRKFRELRLMVTSVNQGAIEFYTRNGFSMTGQTADYPNDPAIFEYEMRCALLPSAATPAWKRRTGE